MRPRGAGLLTLAEGRLALLRPGLRDGRLTPSGRVLFAAVARAVVDGAVPASPPRARAPAGIVDRLATGVAKRLSGLGVRRG